MDQEFRTTFIPKQTPTTDAKPEKVHRGKGASILSLLSWIMFFAALASFGAVYVYEQGLQSQITQYQDSIERTQKEFEPKFIEELRDLDARLSVGNTLLRRHISSVSFFQFLRENTIKDLQFDSFTFGFDEAGVAEVSMNGKARSFQSIAQQSSVLGNTRLINEHIFSDFVVDEEGLVKFSLILKLSPELTLFEERFTTI